MVIGLESHLHQGISNSEFYHIDTMHLEETEPTDGVEYYWLSKTHLFLS